MKKINFDADREERELITMIADRAVAIATGRGQRLEHLDVMMDVTCVHLNGCRLKLAELLEADDFNFIHDIGGIARHLDRNTGELGGCFLPRFAAPETEPAS